MTKPEATTETTPNRGQRRKERTRRSLLDAALAAMSERGVDGTTIADIAERADVAFGSFYNHFDSKEAIIEAVIDESIAAYAAEQVMITEDIDDPARIIAVKSRLAVRKATSDPLWGWFMVRTSLSLPHLRRGLGSHVRRDIRLGVESGRFVVADLNTTLAAASGAMLHVMEAALTGALSDDADRHLADAVLRILGLERAEAAEIADEPIDHYLERSTIPSSVGRPAAPST